MQTQNSYDVLVIGAGHAGCEAALAAARIGARTALVTLNLDTIAMMSCNPAIGGIAKGHLVREIDALGGEMALAIDATGIQFRALNTRKGPAVRSSRAQADKVRYRHYMKQVLEHQANLDILQDQIQRILCRNGRVEAAEGQFGVIYPARSIVLTAGTFLGGMVHIGDRCFGAGRLGEPAAEGLTQSICDLGIRTARLKTGTPARLHRDSIDFSRLEEQPGDENPRPFSFLNTRISQPQVSCWIGWTSPETHRIIEQNLRRSALYGGNISGVGPRYCPSIEDKIVKFPDKDRHQTFLEPEGYDTTEYYVNGMSTSLPYDVQEAFYRSIPGLERAQIMRPAYAIEYDFFSPTQLHPSLETRAVQGLFHAGQVNGTSGYEEAAAQGLIAGVNAARSCSGQESVVLGRDQAYIGVMIDDLVTRGTNEPYRMFTSRAEHRLLLREDNADLRLTELGYEWGLATAERHECMRQRRARVDAEICRLAEFSVRPEQINALLESLGTSPIREPVRAEQLLRRAQVGYAHLLQAGIGDPGLQLSVQEQVEIQVGYAGYIKREELEVDRARAQEHRRIPRDIDYTRIAGLSREVAGKLDDIRPETLGQASRIPGVTPAAISALAIALEIRRREATTP